MLWSRRSTRVRSRSNIGIVYGDMCCRHALGTHRKVLIEMRLKLIPAGLYPCVIHAVVVFHEGTSGSSTML